MNEMSVYVCVVVSAKNKSHSSSILIYLSMFRRWTERWGEVAWPPNFNHKNEIIKKKSKETSHLGESLSLPRYWGQPKYLISYFIGARPSKMLISIYPSPLHVVVVFFTRFLRCLVRFRRVAKMIEISSIRGYINQLATLLFASLFIWWILRYFFEWFWVCNSVQFSRL